MLIAYCRGWKAVVDAVTVCGCATFEEQPESCVKLGLDGGNAAGEDGVVAWRYTNRWIVSGARDPAAAKLSHGSRVPISATNKGRKRRANTAMRGSN